MSEHENMVDDCLARDAKLTEWEQDFIRDMYDWLDSGKDLTEKQAARLDAIWERVTA